jgi:hypothetical protein
MNKPEWIVLHHSLSPDGATRDWDGIRKYHMETNGWNDIGYHAGVERINGVLTTQKGRDDTTVGAHCKEMGMNSKSIGICVVGNFDIAPPDAEILKYLKGLCVAYMVNYNIPVSRVIGHRDAGLMAGFDWQKTGPTGIRQFKTCPGILFPMEEFYHSLMGI